MIERLLGYAVVHRALTLGAALVIAACGVWSWTTLKKEAYPDIGDTQVTVITTFVGRAAEEVEQQVTVPIERALNGTPRLSKIRSKTIFGLSVVQLTFEEGTDDWFARQRVTDRLDDAALPAGVKPELGPLTGPVGEIFRYVVRGTPEQTPMELRTVQDWVVIPRLLQVPGVADVINFGGLVKQYHVITAPDRLLRYGLTIQNVMEAVATNNVNTGGNIVARGGQGFVVRGIGAIRTPDDLENIVVAAHAGVPVFIRDIASVQAFPSPPSGIVGYTLRANGGAVDDVNSGVQGLVAMRRGEDPSRVVDALKARVAEINATEMPPGMRLQITYDRSELVDYTVRTVSRTLFEGFSLVIIVLVFFVGSVRSALVAAATIPFAMLFGFGVMKLTGIPANLLSLGAIDFGIIVEGAVVMVENILRRYSHATTVERQNGIVPLTLSAAHEVGREIFFSIAIILLAYLPLFTLQRVEGKLFRPMAFTLSFAIAGSLLLALTLIPVLMSVVFRRAVESGDGRALEWRNPVYEFLAARYISAITVLTDRPGRTVGVAAAVVALVLAVGIPRVGTEFLPQLDEGAFNIRCLFPVGMTLDESSRYLPEIRRVISAHRQTNVVLAQLGRNDDGTDPYGPNRLEILVGLRDYSTWASDTAKDELLMRIKRELEQTVPGAMFSFSQPILDNVTETVTGSVADLAILIDGNDLDVMRRKAREVLAVVRGIPGATEYGIEQEGNQAQLTIQIDRALAGRFGINVSDVQHIIEGAIGGRPVSTLYDGVRRFDIVVRYGKDYRGSLDAIGRIEVPAPGGARVPLAQLASIRLLDGPTIVQREDGRRQISVRTNIRGRDQGGFAKEAQAKVAGAVALPNGYRMEWGGQYENLSRAAARLTIVIPLTLGIIFLVLFAFYRKLRYVLVVMSCIPFALMGGVVALLVRHYNFNVSAGVGFVSLFGISVMSGVLFVSRTNRLWAEGSSDVIDAVRRAAALQFRPSLMTMLLALLGLLPAATHFGIGSDVQRPLATVIVGGLAGQLVLTLLVPPALYLLVEHKAWREALAARRVDPQSALAA